MGERPTSEPAERPDAGQLIGIRARLNPRVDMGDALSARPLRVKVSVENAAPAAPLQLQARAFANLQRRLAEQLDQLRDVYADQVAVDDI